MATVTITDRRALEGALRRDPFLHIYGIGDLDDAFWPLTTWTALADETPTRPGAPALPARLRGLVLRYEPGTHTVLLALAPPDELAELTATLAAMAPALPNAFTCHGTPGSEEGLRQRYDLVHHGRFVKMALVRPESVIGIADDDIVALGPANEAELRALYDVAYPDTWFDPAMLAKGPQLGLRQGGALVATAGLHVWSPRYGVAALGNITTHPDWRGRGLSRRVTAALCRRCLTQVTTVGLNVRADNQAARRVYQGLGFVDHAVYDEHHATARAPGA